MPASEEVATEGIARVMEKLVAGLPLPDITRMLSGARRTSIFIAELRETTTKDFDGTTQFTGYMQRNTRECMQLLMRCLIATLKAAEHNAREQFTKL